MLQKLKNSLYLPLAAYFRFFAKLKLTRWQPRIIVVTGSSGKTTLLHLLESQIGERAQYSHHANSSYGIPFNILGLSRKTLLPTEWLKLFLLAPIKAFSKSPIQKIYFVEVDCDRPGEGHFLASFLKPEITLWLSLSKTHSMNFDSLVAQNKFPDLESAIAHEFGFLIEHTQNQVFVNADNPHILNQLKRTNANVKLISLARDLKNYQPSLNSTLFKINNITYQLPFLFPQQVFYALSFCVHTLKYLNLKLDSTFSKLTIPPARSSVFTGVKNTIIIDSTYNANLGSMTTILKMFAKLKAPNKWLVLGDMLELGKSEKLEHELLAQEIAKLKADNIILMGPRISQYTYPKLKLLTKTPIKTFLHPKPVLEYLNTNLKGNELILFKGARFLEGVIEHLLKDKSDIAKLSRREKIWDIRRKKWGL